MSSKREEERNEKIIRGLMKLPPNRRCINCNSLGPQYVCTNFWTFVCITCSGIHREFTHRVKSVSMAKFTSQEVDALQSGGNQRARELFLKDWDPQKNRLPDNSNIDKVREFIKKVYIEKLYFQEKLTDRPPRDPQSLRSHEDQTRRASSYHSYSQSPPYDFQYEERRYGKHGPVLTRKPGSDRGLYEGKLASFLSPTRISDHANDERFANDPRFSDYPVSGGGDTFRSDALSPSSQRDSGSPFSESSRDISNEVPQLHKVLQGSDANNTSNGGKVSHQQIAGASGSFGSFDNNPMPCKPVNSLDKSSSLPSLPQSSVSMTFDELDLFSSPFPPQNGTSVPSSGTTQLPHSLLAPSHNVVRDKSSTFPSLPVDEFDFFSKPFTSQNVTSQSPSGGNTQLPSSLAQSLNVVHPLPISSGPAFAVQKPSQNSQASPAGLFSVPSQQNNGGWATFDMPQNVVSMGGEKSAPVEMLSSDGNVIGNFNPFSVDESSYYIASSGHEPYALPARAFGHEHLQNVETTINQTQSWSAFDDPAGGQPIQEVIRGDKQASVPYVSDANNFLGFGVYEGFNNDGNATGTNESEPPLSSLHTNSSMTLNGFPMVSAVTGVHPLPTDHKPANPFDLPLDSDMESSNVFWNMSSLQAALPNTQAPPSYTVNQSWNFENSVPSYAPGGPFGPTSGSLAFMAGEASSTQVPSIHAQGPVASMGGNPFA